MDMSTPKLIPSLYLTLMSFDQLPIMFILSGFSNLNVHFVFSVGAGEGNGTSTPLDRSFFAIRAGFSALPAENVCSLVRWSCNCIRKASSGARAVFEAFGVRAGSKLSI